MNKQFKVGQVWKARGGWVYPPITEVGEKWVRIGGPGPAFDVDDGKIYIDPSIFDLVELVQDAPEPKPKTRRPFTLADMPGLDVMMWLKCRRFGDFVFAGVRSSWGIEGVSWNDLMERYKYTTDRKACSRCPQYAYSC